MGNRSPPISGADKQKRPPSETPLSLWLRANSISRYGLAKRLQCDVKLVKLWSMGKCLPSLVYAFKLERETEGGVPASSWLGTPLGLEVWNSVGNQGKARG